jgi:predicted transcriptional regulator
MVEKYSLWDRPLKDICAKAAGKKVKNFMYKPTEEEYIEEGDTLDDAIHLLVLGNHQSLLVTKVDKITGILRLTDVFAHVCKLVKACEF